MMPQINEKDTQSVRGKKGDGLPFAVKLLLWIVVGLCSTISTVVPYLVKKNDVLIESRDLNQIRCDREKQEMQELTRIRTAELNRYKDSIIEHKNNLLNMFVQERVSAIRKDINKLNKELK